MRVALYCLSLLWCCCICSSVFSQDTKTLTQSLETIFKDVRSGEKKVLIDDCIATWTSSFCLKTRRTVSVLSFRICRHCVCLRLQNSGILRSV